MIETACCSQKPALERSKIQISDLCAISGLGLDAMEAPKDQCEP